MQEKILHFVQNDRFQNFIILLIIINSITMGFETSKSIMLEYGDYYYLHHKDLKKSKS